MKRFVTVSFHISAVLYSAKPVLPSSAVINGRRNWGKMITAKRDIAKTATFTVLDSIRPKNIEIVKMVQSEPLWKLARASGPFVRLAAVSGATAVILGAYGSHKAYPPEEKGQEQRRVFDTASRYHFIHTLALLGLPMCRMPLVAGTFITSGIFLFCGTCYYYAFTGDKSFSKLTPIGGTCFILGWLGMVI